MNFLVWATVTLGTGLSDPLAVRKALKSVSKVGDVAALMIEAGTVATERIDVDLVALSCTELGCEPRTPLSEVIASALTQGLVLCTSEVPWQCCLQHHDNMDKSDRLLFVTEPMSVTNVLGQRRPTMFVAFTLHGKLWLGADPGMDAAVYGPETRYVFTQPRA